MNGKCDHINKLKAIDNQRNGRIFAIESIMKRLSESGIIVLYELA